MSKDHVGGPLGIDAIVRRDPLPRLVDGGVGIMVMVDERPLPVVVEEPILHEGNGR